MNTNQPPADKLQSVPWVRTGDLDEQGEERSALIGNREGLLALRTAVDAALDKGESFIEAYEIEFAYIRLCDQDYPDPKASPAPVAPTAGRDMRTSWLLSAVSSSSWALQPSF